MSITIDSPQDAYDGYIEQARRCRALADKAIEDGSPVGAREWIDAADAAQAAADRLLRYPTPTKD